MRLTKQKLEQSNTPLAVIQQGQGPIAVLFGGHVAVVSVNVCVCGYKRDERERETDRDRQREMER